MLHACTTSAISLMFFVPAPGVHMHNEVSTSHDLNLHGTVLPAMIGCSLELM